MTPYLPDLDIPKLYAGFDAPVTEVDCGQQCAVHNPSGLPFCCDICLAVPVAYRQEWAYLQQQGGFWHLWRGDECDNEPCDPEELRAETPDHLCLLACQGVQHCQRNLRATSCRQFPFFPYVTSDYRFIGLAYDWDFETRCWVISHLEQVTSAYRRQFTAFYDALFALWQEDFDSYADLSEDMREHFIAQKRRIPLLHRNGGYYWISPRSERLTRANPAAFRRFGPYDTPRRGQHVPNPCAR